MTDENRTQTMGERRAAAAAKRVQRRLNLANALEMRLAGYTWAQIIKEIPGYKTESGAYAAVNRHLTKRIEEPAAELFTLELARLDAMQSAIWSAAMGGDVAAIDRVIRITQRRSRMLGLDRPIKVDLSAIVEQVASSLGFDEDDTAGLLTDVETYMAKSGSL
jgi:hypothetical protein